MNPFDHKSNYLKSAKAMGLLNNNEKELGESIILLAKLERKHLGVILADKGTLTHLCSLLRLCYDSTKWYKRWRYFFHSPHDKIEEFLADFNWRKFRNNIVVKMS